MIAEQTACRRKNLAGFFCKMFSSFSAGALQNYGKELNASADETNVISLQDIFKQSQKLSETATDVLAKLVLARQDFLAANRRMTKAEREEQKRRMKL